MRERFDPHTVALGTRHLVRLAKLAIDGGDGPIYLSLLHDEQRSVLDTAIRFHEANLLERGYPVE